MRDVLGGLINDLNEATKAAGTDTVALYIVKKIETEITEVPPLGQRQFNNEYKSRINNDERTKHIESIAQCIERLGSSKHVTQVLSDNLDTILGIVKNIAVHYGFELSETQDSLKMFEALKRVGLTGFRLSRDNLTKKDDYTFKPTTEEVNAFLLQEKNLSKLCQKYAEVKSASHLSFNIKGEVIRTRSLGLDRIERAHFYRVYVAITQSQHLVDKIRQKRPEEPCLIHSSQLR